MIRGIGSSLNPLGMFLVLCNKSKVELLNLTQQLIFSLSLSLTNVLETMHESVKSHYAKTGELNLQSPETF